MKKVEPKNGAHRIFGSPIIMNCFSRLHYSLRGCILVEGRLHLSNNDADIIIHRNGYY